MEEYALTFGLVLDGEDNPGAYLERSRRVFTTAFSFGPAWHGSQRAIFFRSARATRDMMKALTASIDHVDFLLLVQLTGPREVNFAGFLVDEVGFWARFPRAIEFPLPVGDESDPSR